jgi:hypothetical protein
MLLPSRLLRHNGNPLAGGDDLGCGCFDFVGGSRADACLLGSGLRRAVAVDRCEPLLGDAKRHRPIAVIAAPDRERAGGADLLQQAGADELIGSLPGRFVLDVRRQFNSAIIALRGRGQNDELRIGES